MRKVGIVGAGVVGTAVGAILYSRGHEVTGAYDLNPESTKNLGDRVAAMICQTPCEVSRSAEILFITTNDSAIGEVAENIAREGGFSKGQMVVHMSGALSSDVLSPAKSQGAQIISIHPMQSFANIDRAITNLPGSVFSIEGDVEGYKEASSLVKELGGEFFFIDQKAKPLYHAGACVVSNYLVTLIDFGLQLLESIGIPRSQALQAFLPLVKGTILNIEKIGVPRALTGPIARGDLVTVLKHLDCLEEKGSELTQLYSLLGYFTAQVAANKGTIDEVLMNEFKKVFMRELFGNNMVRLGGEGFGKGYYRGIKGKEVATREDYYADCL